MFEGIYSVFTGRGKLTKSIKLLSFSPQTVLCPCVKGYYCKPFSKTLGRCTKDDIKT